MAVYEDRCTALSRLAVPVSSATKSIRSPLVLAGHESSPAPFRATSAVGGPMARPPRRPQDRRPLAQVEYVCARLAVISELAKHPSPPLLQETVSRQPPQNSIRTTM